MGVQLSGDAGTVGSRSSIVEHLQLGVGRKQRRLSSCLSFVAA